MATDWLKDVGAAFERIGRGAKNVADDVRKVVGIGVGSIHLELARFDFSSGDAIEGRLRLALSEPTDAKRVVVALTGTRDKTTYDKDIDGRRVRRTFSETVYKLERELGAAGSYHDELLPFKLVVPGDAVRPNPDIRSEGWVGDVARVVSSIASARNAIQWRVIAFVDVPWRRNIRTHVDISIAG